MITLCESEPTEKVEQLFIPVAGQADQVDQSVDEKSDCEPLDLIPNTIAHNFREALMLYGMPHDEVHKKVNDFNVYPRGAFLKDIVK